MLALVADSINLRFLHSRVYSTILGTAAAAVAIVLPAFLLVAAIPLFDLSAGASPRKGTLPVALVLAATLAALVGTVVPVPFIPSRETAAMEEILGTLSLIAAAIFLGYGQYRSDRATLHARRFADIARRSRYEKEDQRESGNRMARELVQSVELRERERISHALHDTVGHRLTGVLMQVQAARKLLDHPENSSGPGNDETVQQRLDRCVRELAETLRMMRETVHDLRPRSVTARERIERTVRSFSFCPVRLSIDSAVERINPALLHEMARTVEEALTNVARHSAATEVAVTLTLRAGDLALMVRDNGVGCPTGREGLGLRGIRTRAEERGGTLTIENDDGFLMCVSLPGEHDR
jgi:signal transduction histidine kinase